MLSAVTQKVSAVHDRADNRENCMIKVEITDEYDVIKSLFTEYSQIKGAEGCFISFDKELENLKGFYKDGAILVGYEDGEPAGCIAIKKIDETKCEAKRLFIKPDYRGKGSARILLNSMLEQARMLGYKLVTFTTRPDVMKTAYDLYKRMEFEEIGCNDGVVSMKIAL